MLILHRKENESIFIGDNIRITVAECSSGGVRLAIDAPKDIKVIREELVYAEQINKAALAPELDSICFLETALKQYLKPSE